LRIAEKDKLCRAFHDSVTAVSRRFEWPGGFYPMREDCASVTMRRDSPYRSTEMSHNSPRVDGVYKRSRRLPMQGQSVPLRMRQAFGEVPASRDTVPVLKSSVEDAA
jgi:hypothetical protein